jgi:hypothetical protein
MVLVLLSILGLSLDGPTVWSPYPGAQFLLFTAGCPLWTARLGPPVVYAMLMLGLTALSQRSRYSALGVLMAVLTVLSLVYFSIRIPTGLVHQGLVHTASVTLVNLAVILTFWVYWVRWRGQQLVRGTFLLGLMVFAWLAWMAFPYFGEGI